MHGREREQLSIVRHVSTASLLSVLGGGVRIEILQELARGPKDVGALARELELAIGTISHNLRILREYRLVDFEHRGTIHVYGLAPRLTLERHKGAVWLCGVSDEGDTIRIRFKSLSLNRNIAAET